MSWNRGESETHGSAGRGECEATGTSRLRLVGSGSRLLGECKKATGTSLPRLLGVAVGVAVMVIAVWMCCRRVRSDGDVASPAVASAKAIVERKPNLAPKEDAPPVVSNAPPEEVHTNFVNNVWHDEKGRPHYKVARVIRPGQQTVINGKPFKPEKPVFHHASEVELDVLLSRKPGERIFGNVNWKAFERDLPLALASSIEILPEDTPDIIERKQLVMEAKQELAEAIKSGEDPMEILKFSREEVNRLADIRDGLLSIVAELRQQGASEQEIEDAVESANAMLRQYNIDQPIVSPRTMRERAQAARLRKLQNQKGN